MEWIQRHFLCLSLVYMLIGTRTCQQFSPDYSRMVMDNDDSLFVAGKNTIYHFNQTYMNEINRFLVGPYNGSNVHVTVMEFVSLQPAMLFVCVSSENHCYSLNANHIDVIIENDTKIISKNAVTFFIPQQNNWLVACPYHSTNLGEEGYLCQNAGIFQMTSGIFQIPNSDQKQVKFKDVSQVDDNAQIKKFIAGFAFGSSRFFFSLQGHEMQTSHVLHVCQNSLKFTYIDMPISCGYNNILTDVKEVSSLFVASFTNRQWQGSTICVYSLDDVVKRLIENKYKCYQAKYTYGGRTDYIVGDGRCTPEVLAGDLYNFWENKTDSEKLCDGNLQKYFGVIGDLHLQASPVIQFEEQVIKSITLAKREDVIVAFLGSYQDINKAVINPQNRTAKLLEMNFTVTGPLRDLLNDGTSLYALTKWKILKLPMSKCDLHMTCTECLADRDPDCGWCILGNLCSTSTECERAYRWLPAKNTRTSMCPRISQIEPRIIDIKEAHRNISITMTPDINISNFGLNCSFHSKWREYQFTKIVPAISYGVNLGEIYCQDPHQEVRDIMDQLKGTLIVQVDIFSELSDHPLVTSNLTYYKCDFFHRCMECVNANWECSWCPFENSCLDRGSNCQQDGSTIMRKDDCPVCRNFTYNEQLSDSNGSLVVTKDVYPVMIYGDNFLQPGGRSIYSCETRMSEAVSHLANFINSSAVKCIVDLMSQDLEAIQTGTFNTQLSLKFGESYVDGETQQVTVYNCGKLIRPMENCGECKSFRYVKPYFRCGWCDGKCVYTGDTCMSGTDSQCPPPTITKVWPLTVYVNATTRIDIEGYNLGSHFNETVDTVTVAGRPCRSLENHYIPSKQISCEVGPAGEPIHGHIRIMMGHGVQASEFADHEIFFKVPQIKSVCPKIGPKSGGTTICINGIDLTIGRTQTAYVSGLLCKKSECLTKSSCFKQRDTSQTTLCCKTGSADNSMINQLSAVNLEFDGEPLIVRDVMYKYVEDPVIESIQPRESFKEGGRTLTVSGQNLLSIQEPKIYLKSANNGKMMSSKFPCTSVNRSGEKNIYCPSPTLIRRSRKRGRSKRQDKRFPNTIIAFEMDGVKSVGNLSGDIASIAYYSNPQIKQFNGTEKYSKVLIIEGTNLNVAATKEDFKVWIGSVAKCNITTLENERIYCNPPPKPPIHSTYHFSVEVEIGYFKETVGILQYVETDSTSNDAVITVVAVIVCVVVVVAFLFALMFFLKKRKAMNKEKKTLEYMMDKKEAKYREQCRKEFAGLQTAMSDLTSDLSGGNVLFREYNVYATYVLFTFDKDHAITKPPQVMTDNSNQAMDVFKSLLRNKQFLLSMIRTLDKEKKFTIQDKSTVASILMTLNHDNMEYITEILKTLLNDLIDKNVGAHTEKLLLRRSECVAEKLLAHWLSICLYHYLKERSGSPLFILYKAIKIQIERGPVDYISNCAKFTMSEDKLLEEDINPNPLNVQVTHSDYMENEEKTITLSVLECDTISQVKSKILEVFYKNVGYSQRPSVHNTQIEWLQEDSTTRVLSDEDPASLKDGIWKRINTLEYYGVKDGAKMFLAHSRRGNVDTLHPGAGNPDYYIGSLKRNKQVVRTISGSNFWHLTKQHQGDSDEVKITSDILLPRLLVTKGTLQSYVDDLISEILCVTEDPPIIIKYLFDFLDKAAQDHGISDPDVLHTWKCNSFLLRFWVNIMKNPEFVFDIYKPNNVDKCLSVVAQAFMDSCSTADVNLGSASPSNKLLFAKDIPRYKTLVKEYFQHVRNKPPVSDQDVNAFLTEKVSLKFSGNFHQSSALMEMYKYVSTYRTAIQNELDNLEAESPGQYSPVMSKLQLLYMMMDKESGGT